MGGRELKEDLKKIQDATGATYNQCLQAFVASKHNVDKAIESLNWMSENVIFFEHE